MRSPPLRLLVLAPVLPACGTVAALEDEWEVTREQLADLPLELVAQYPAPEGRILAPNVDPYYFFNRPLSDEEAAGLSPLMVVDLGNGDVREGEPELDEDGSGVRYSLARLTGGRSYNQTFRLPSTGAVPGEPITTRFETDSALTRSFQMAEGLSFEAFGGNPLHATQLNDAYATAVPPIWILDVEGFGAEPELPAVIQGRFAPARVGLPEDGERAWYLHRYYGSLGVFDDLAVGFDGRFDQEQPGLFLPLWWRDADVAVLYLTEVELSGRFEVSGGQVRLEELRVAGILGTRWLLGLERLGGQWSQVVDAVELDVDTNGNDVPDSVTFELSSWPVAVPPSDVDIWGR